MRFLVKSFQTISQYLLPSACIVCERHQANSICSKCLEVLDAQALFNYECCRQCGIALKRSELKNQHCEQCKLTQPHFDATYCFDRYEGVLQNAIHQLKYHQRLVYAHGLASAWNEIYSGQLKHVNASYLLPVPLSTQKLSRRGFNQSWEIARRVNCGPNIKKLPNVLRRYHHEFQQVGSALTDRRLAIRNMFYLEENSIPLLRNKNLIIFDDVMTSGATLNEIARILKDNGVAHVINWVVLRTARVPYV